MMNYIVDDINKYSGKSDNKDFEVKYFMVSIRPINIESKIKKMGQKLKTIYDYTDLIYKINEKYRYEINDQPAMRAAIEFQFEDQTKNHFLKLTLLYIFCYVLPLAVQFHDNGSN